ncbi:baseplate J/gp47 family protein [Pseudoalteromonas sp. MMG012]|uniref:baseplate assembly protein n=1 Tax=Pseudoalteromonas sp. MMG012 TaxID=2822686 RepID=UPI001B3A73C3|nr:baseplate J/gp47 family protein [Pseudoalteromonas sp. MMG012]MBQ4851014.1 baseplate J/gp47 family protein [Pseudoalteromonas sp. MMG012]
MNNAIELSRLAVPDVIEPLKYDDIYQQMENALTASFPNYAVLASDPAIKLLDIAASRELLLRQRINDAARSVMVAYAKGEDLNHLGVLFGVKRGDAESDERYRARIPLSLESHSMAGTMGAYEYQALAASHHVKDVYVTSSAPGIVDVYVLPEKDANPDSVLHVVSEHLNDEDIRPLTDLVKVHMVTPKKYEISAQIHFHDGADRSAVSAKIDTAIAEFTLQHYKLGQEVPHSGLIDALHQAGVRKVKLLSPQDDISCEVNQAAIASLPTLTFA